MFSHTTVALYALVLAGAAAAQSMTVATPASIVQCQPAQLSWSGGTAPYFPSIIPGQQAGAPALKEFPSQTGTSLVWNADLIAGTYITIQVRDSTGAIQYSSAISIQGSSDSSCVNGNVSASASGGATATGGTTPTSPAGSSGSTTTPAATPSGSNGASSGAATGSSSRATSTAPAATHSASNAASILTKSAFGIAGFAGLIGAALF